MVGCFTFGPSSFCLVKPSFFSFSVIGVIGFVLCFLWVGLGKHNMHLDMKNLKKEKKKEKLIESQKGSMDKFVISNKQNIDENIINEQEIHQKELEDNKRIQLQDNNDVQFCNTTNLDNELQKNLEENENNDENVTNEQEK